MKNKLQLLSSIVFLTLVLNSNTFGYTTISSDISDPLTVWATGNTYYISNSITVLDGSTLIIEPGAVVKFIENSKITVKGYLYAVGNSSSKIYFTSKHDNSVGESILGSSGSPTAGDWATVEINGVNESTSVSRGIFEYCDFQYGGNSSAVNYALSFNEANANNNSVTYCSFDNNYEGKNLYTYAVNKIENVSNNTFNNPTGYNVAANIKQSDIQTFSTNTITINNSPSTEAYFSFYYMEISSDATWNHNSLIKITGNTTLSTPLKTLTITGPTSKIQFVQGGSYSTGYISGSGNFNFDNGELIIQNTDGIVSGTTAGAIRNSGTRTLSTSAKYTFLTPMDGGSQVTGSGFPTSVGEFQIQNSQNVTLTNNVTISEYLHLTEGNIITGSNIITLGTGTSVLGTLVRTSGTIIGNFARWFAASTVNDVLFPVGDATNYRPVSISYPTYAPSPGGTLTIAFSDSDPGNNGGLPLNVAVGTDAKTGDPIYDEVDRYFSDGYWTITNSGLGSTTPGYYAIDLNATNFLGINDVSKLHILKRENSGASWSSPGTHVEATGTTSSPIVSKRGLQNYSEFGIGSTSDNPLPVELTSFTANMFEKHVNLNWVTVTEVNSYGFEILRLADNESAWESIGFVEGSGNSNSEKEYSFIDELSATEQNYRSIAYKLKQIDIDGKYKYSNIAEINLNSLEPNSFELFQNYPNPFNPSTTINFSLAQKEFVSLKVFDALGQEITSLINSELDAGQHSIEFSEKNIIGSLTSGIYIYQLQAGDFVQSKKMILLK